MIRVFLLPGNRKKSRDEDLSIDTSRFGCECRRAFASNPQEPGQLKPVFSEQRKLKGRALKLRHEVPHVLLATEKVTQKYLCSRSLKSLMAPIGSHDSIINHAEYSYNSYNTTSSLIINRPGSLHLPSRATTASLYLIQQQ